MSDDTHFIYPSTFPKQVDLFTHDPSLFTLGPMSLSEAMQFYWRLQSITISAALNVRVFDNETLCQIWDEHKTCSVASCESGYSVAKPPSHRCVAGAFFRGAQEPYPIISGPYMGGETDFEFDNFYFTLDFYFAAGPVVLQSRACDENYGADMTSYRQFNFALFKKQYSVYMNVPKIFASPNMKYNVQIDGDCEINFNFYNS